jgi:hypothetical protein
MRIRNPFDHIQCITFLLAMITDNIEPVISYWMLYQKLHLPASAGFAFGAAPSQSIIISSPPSGGPCCRPPSYSRGRVLLITRCMA